MIAQYVCLLLLPVAVLSQCTTCTYDKLPANRQRLVRRQVKTLDQPIDEDEDLTSLVPSYQDDEPGFLPTYSGDRYTDTSRILETQLLNQAFFDALKTLDSRHLLDLPTVTAHDDPSASGSSSITDVETSSTVKTTTEKATTPSPAPVQQTVPTFNSRDHLEQTIHPVIVEPKQTRDIMAVSRGDITEFGSEHESTSTNQEDTEPEMTIIEFTPDDHFEFDENYLSAASQAIYDALKSRNMLGKNEDVQLTFDDEISPK